MSEIAKHWIDGEWVGSDTASEHGSWTVQTNPAPSLPGLALGSTHNDHLNHPVIGILGL